jgi:hypothetical protein
MFSPIEGGSSIDIQGLNCHIPAEGYVFNLATRKVEHRGVYKRSNNPKEQYWERTPLPGWYKDVMKREDAYEKKRKEDDPPFYDEQLEKYKQQEWDRRLNGFWFMNNGKPTYITGAHYMYMQWFQIDIGYPRFRQPDLEYFYFLQYVIEDPECMGMLEVTKRRFGKTYRGGLFLYEYITRTRMTNGAIQSKTGNDAKKVFAKAVVAPFKKLPKFFRPEYDTSLGITPKSEIRFQQTNVRGKKAEDNIEKEELGSMIDWGSADAIHYDGQKLHRYFADEFAKTTETNIYDRHEVVRYCLLDDEGRIIGKALYSSTVEKLETERDGIQDAARKLWDDSDQNAKQGNGRTPSGLYRFFMSADRAKNFDLYGIPDVEKTIKEIIADRESVKHNTRALAKRIKKEARTIEEAFSNDADDCIFNVQNINAQIAYLRQYPVQRFRYLNFYRDIDTQKVKWRDVDPNRTDLFWKVLVLPPNGQDNQYKMNVNMRMPTRGNVGVIGVDGYSNSQGGKEYGSKLSGWYFIKFDMNDPENTGLFGGHIYGRPNEKEDMYNQILLCSEYMSFPTYFEFVSDDYYTYFKNRGRLGYLGRFPKNSIDPVRLKKDKIERHFGFPTTEFALTKQNDAMITYIEHYANKIYYEELLDDLLKFKPYKRTPSDRAVSAMITLVSSLEPMPAEKTLSVPLVRIFNNAPTSNIHMPFVTK